MSGKEDTSTHSAMRLVGILPRAAAGDEAQVVCFKICIVRLGGKAAAGGDPLQRDEGQRRSSRVQPPAGGQTPAPSSRESTGCAFPIADETEHKASQT